MIISRLIIHDIIKQIMNIIKQVNNFSLFIIQILYNNKIIIRIIKYLKWILLKEQINYQFVQI
jgi:hypothetical protein